MKLIGHEARKPLVSLVSTASLLLSGIEGELSDQVRRDVEKIKHNAETALEKVDLIIAYYKELSDKET